MEAYYFLFGIAFVYTIIASFLDIKTREVPNWLSFSFISSALAYRLFYSIYSENYGFIAYGVIGFLVFYLLANLFYYAKVFAGGDAKLLMAFGLIFPFDGLNSLFIYSLGFVFVLFAVGSIYSLIYSVFLVFGNYDKFKVSFIRKFKNGKNLFIYCLVFVLILFIETIVFNSSKTFFLFGSLFLLSIPFLFIYMKALEESCMIKLVSAQKVTEGDWLERDVRVAGKTLRKSVHGLNYKEISFLRKNNKKVWIRYGVPFVPAFLISLIIMALFFLVLKPDFLSWIYFLF